MAIDIKNTRNHLKDFDFKTLFIEELGWDHFNTQIDVPVDSHTFKLSAIAEKKGMGTFTCGPLTNGQIPDYAIRRKMDNQTAIRINIYFSHGG